MHTETLAPKSHASKRLVDQAGRVIARVKRRADVPMLIAGQAAMQIIGAQAKLSEQRARNIEADAIVSAQIEKLEKMREQLSEERFLIEGKLHKLLAIASGFLSALRGNHGQQ